MDRRTWLTALALALLMLAVKLALVFSLSDVFFYGEELEKGTAAKAMIDGLPVPHYMLSYHYYEGGGFAISHLTALAFRLVGQNLLAHKLVSVCFNLAILLVGFAFVRRNWGLAAGTIFGVLYTFAPPGIQKISLLNLGIHYESQLFFVLLFLLGTQLLFGAEPRKRTLFAFGLTAGFGAFFNYQMLPVTAFLVAALLLLRRSALKSGRLLTVASGAALGALPLFYMWQAVGSEVFNIHGTSLFGGAADDTESDGIAKVGTFLYTLLRGGGPLEHLRFVLALSLPFVGLFVVTRGHPSQSTRRRGAYFALFAYAAFFALLYINSAFVVGVVDHHFKLQRTTPFWMMGICMASATIGTLLASEQRKARVRGWVCALVLVAYGVQGTIETIAAAPPGSLAANTRLLLDIKGYTYAEYFAKFLPHIDGNDEERLVLALQFDELDRPLLRSEVATALYAKSDLLPEEIVATLKRTDPEHWEEYLPGLGQYLFRAGANNMEIALRILWRGPPEHRSSFVEALGRRGVHMRTQPEALELELFDLQGSELPLSYYRGFGHRVYLGFRLDPIGAATFLASVPDRYRPMVTRGYEVARTLRTRRTSQASPSDE